MLPNVSYGLHQYAHLLPTNGIALDLACGLGQNSIFLIKHGLTVHSWDYSTVALEQMKHHCDTQKIEINQRCIDLITQPWPSLGFDVICVTAFLNRNLCPQIIERLNPGGVLVYQTFNQVTEIAGKSLHKPKRTEFLLAKGELLELFNELDPLVYHDQQELAQSTHALFGKALLIAQKPKRIEARLKASV
ncbi:MAG: class I SAM-dependent methyltransferase [Oceanospirillaceae bacterium]|nr:class I SAM-dependent methyltransferase [Oceanospirillaceae bacterium]